MLTTKQINEIDSAYYGGMWEIELEKKCYYRGTANHGIKQLDICGHKHRTPESARKCGRNLLSKYLHKLMYKQAASKL